MTQIEFHHDAADKLGEACRLVALLHAKQRRIAVFAPDPVLARRFDHLLWSQPALSFVPHVSTAHTLAARTPVVIAHDLAEVEHDEVVLNLSNTAPEGFQRFAALIEVVGRDDADRHPARERFRFYRDRGYDIRTCTAGGEHP